MRRQRKAKKQASTPLYHPTPPLRNNAGIFSSQSKELHSARSSRAPEQYNVDSDSISDLVDDSTTTFDDKLARVTALHARWNYEDTEEEALEGDALQTWQRSRCKELGMIVFGFELHDA